MDAFASNLSSLQQPSDFIILMIYCTIMLSPIRIVSEAGTLRKLAASSEPVSVKDLVQTMEDAPAPANEEERLEREEYIARMLRSVAALNLADEVAPGVYQGNELKRTLADPGFEAGFVEVYDNTMGPSSTASHMLSWAKDNGYKVPRVSTDGPFQRSRSILGTTTFQHWVKDDLLSLTQLSAFMKRIQPVRLNWIEWFRSEVLFSGEPDSNRIFMVDVGGGMGHDISAFASRYPDRKMCLVLQDLPEVIDEGKTHQLDDRIERSEHDFFKPEPIKGELSGKERSETMWKSLISRVGRLEVKNFWQAPELKGGGIVEVVKVA
jgi:demethylsterigmatocystin 6-O-methyltransferase